MFACQVGKCISTCATTFGHLYLSLQHYCIRRQNGADYGSNWGVVFVVKFIQRNAQKTEPKQWLRRD